MYVYLYKYYYVMFGTLQFYFILFIKIFYWFNHLYGKLSIYEHNCQLNKFCSKCIVVQIIHTFVWFCTYTKIEKNVIVTKDWKKKWNFLKDHEKNAIFIKGSQKRHKFHQRVSENKIQISLKDCGKQQFLSQDHGKDANFIERSQKNANFIKKILKNFIFHQKFLF